MVSTMLAEPVMLLVLLPVLAQFAVIVQRVRKRKPVTMGLLMLVEPVTQPAMVQGKYLRVAMGMFVQRWSLVTMVLPTHAVLAMKPVAVPE